MGERRRTALVVALLIGDGLLGLGSVQGLPAGSFAVGIWPVALGTICCLLVGRSQVLRLGGALTVIDATVLLAAGRGPTYAVLLGLGLAAQSVVTGWLLCPADESAGRRPTLQTMSDATRLMRSSVAGAAALALAGLLAGVVTDNGSPVMLALTVGLAGFAGQVSLLPLVCRMRDVTTTAGVLERGLQWVAILVAGAVVFAPTNAPSLVILVFPVLAWACLRSSSTDARAELLLLQAAATFCTGLGRGPLGRPDRYFPVPVDAQTLLLAVFVAITSLQVIVLVVTVGALAHTSGVAAAERDRGRRILASITTTAVIGTDRDGLINLFNPGAERLLGYREEEVLGKTTAMLHPPQAISDKAAELGLEDELQVVARALVDCGPVEMAFLRADGVERRHLLSLHQVLDEHGDLAGRVATSEDVSDILETQARLVEALNSQRTAVEHIQELDRVKDAFVASVSHELRTPLTSILGYLELLQDGSYGALERRQQSAVNRVQLNCTRLIALINDLLDLGRLEEGGADPGVRLDLAHLTRTVLPILEPAAATRQVELITQLPDEPLPVRGQRGPLERVVMNLVDNAIKFTEAGGRVTVRARVEDRTEEIVLEVADTGIGIPVGEQQQLFGRFFRSSVAQERAIPGTGLGLSITRVIVEQHGGTIAVCSEPDVGTTFTVRLPMDMTYASPPPELVAPPMHLDRVRVASTAQP